MQQTSLCLIKLYGYIKIAAFYWLTMCTYHFCITTHANKIKALMTLRFVLIIKNLTFVNFTWKIIKYTNSIKFGHFAYVWEVYQRNRPSRCSIYDSYLRIFCLPPLRKNSTTYTIMCVCLFIIRTTLAHWFWYHVIAHMSPHRDDCERPIKRNTCKWHKTVNFHHKLTNKFPTTKILKLKSWQIREKLKIKFLLKDRSARSRYSENIFNFKHARA